MNDQTFVSLLNVQPLKKKHVVFHKIQERSGWRYSYFEANGQYYLFVYGKGDEAGASERLFDDVEIIQSLDRQKRRVRSFRGFAKLALEQMAIEGIEGGAKVIHTNLNPLFWEDVNRILRKNQKDDLENYLFPNDKRTSKLAIDPVEFLSMKEEIKILQKELETLTTAVLILESKVEDLETREF